MEVLWDYGGRKRFKGTIFKMYIYVQQPCNNNRRIALSSLVETLCMMHIRK